MTQNPNALGARCHCDVVYEHDTTPRGLRVLRRVHADQCAVAEFIRTHDTQLEQPAPIGTPR